MGIEPTLFAWEAKVLPLNYTRTSHRFSLWLNAFSLFPLLVLACPACVVREAACLRSFAPLQPGCCSGAGGAQGTNAPFHAGVVLSMVLGVFGLKRFAIKR